MINSYAPSKLEVHYGTEEKFEKVETRSQQRIEVPIEYVEDVKLSGGRTRILPRAVTVLGTVEVSRYGVRRVECGKCHVNGHIVFVVKDGTIWSAVYRKTVDGCIA